MIVREREREREIAVVSSTTHKHTRGMHALATTIICFPKNGPQMKVNGPLRVVLQCCPPGSEV